MAQHSGAQEFGTHLSRHRRLDLRAVARRVLSRRACRRRRSSSMPRSISPRSRSTARSIARRRRRPSASGRRRCRTASSSRSRGRASRPIGACSRRPANSIKRFLDSGVTELGDRLGPLLWQFAADQEIRRGRFRRASSSCCRRRSTAAAAPRGRGAPRQLRVAGLHRAAAQVRDRRWCSPSTRPIRRSPTSPPISSICACRRARNTIETGYPPKALDAWAERAARPGRGRRAGRPASRRATKAEEAAARRVRLRHPRGQGARARRRDGADRTASKP